VNRSANSRWLNWLPFHGDNLPHRVHARFAVSLRIPGAWAGTSSRAQSRLPIPASADHPAHRPRRAIGKGADQRGADDAAAILNRADQR